MVSARRSRWYCLLLAAVPAALLCSGGGASGSGPELIVNGGFERGFETDPGDTRLDPGSGVMEGWTVIRGSIDFVGGAWASPDGVRSLDLEGEAAFGGVAQTIPTEPGRTYTVRFDLAGNPDGQPRIKKMRVQAAGQSTERWFDCAGRAREDLGWQTHTWQFLATDERTTIEFLSVEDGPGHCGAMIDNVSVIPSFQPWGTRKRVARHNVREPGADAVVVKGDLRLESPIPVELSAGAGGEQGVVRISSVVFVMDDGWLQARLSARIVSWPKGTWRLVVELRDGRNVVRRGDVRFENAGIIEGVAMVEERVLRVDLGPWEKGDAKSFRLAIETLGECPGGIRK